MEEIQAGEFVRTKDGQIDKVINDKYYMQAYIECQKDVIWRNGIVKHSFNLIDLIEKGDYINGISVIGNYEGVFESGIELANHYKINFLDSKTKIKSIVTKEQFASLEYKVED